MTHSFSDGGGRIPAARMTQKRLIAKKVGPMPRRSLRAFLDYGMEDADIARYLGLTASSVRRIRRMLDIRRDSPDRGL